MTPWIVGSLILLIGGFAPALWIASRGEAPERLVGLEFAGVVATFVLLLLATQWGQSSYLIVPLVMALVSFAGTLVFTRLLGRQGDEARVRIAARNERGPERVAESTIDAETERGKGRGGN